MPKLSIVTPTFNRAKKLPRNFEGVLKQTFQDIEHIIVDNLSDDGTEQLVLEYIKKAPYPVVYIREKDTGIYNAMNKGIRQAKGLWVHILNSDDAYYSDRCVESVCSSQNDVYDIVCAPIIVDYAPAAGMWFWRPEYEAEKKFYNFPHPGTVIKKKFYMDNGYYDERFKMVADSVYNIVNYPKAKYRILENTLVIMDGGGISTRRSFRNALEYLYHLFVYHHFSLRQKSGLLVNYYFSKKRLPDEKFPVPEWWSLRNQPM